MSAARPTGALDARKHERGITLLETLITLTLLVFLISVVSNVSVNSTSSSKYSERMARAVEVGQELLNEIRGELLSTVDLMLAGTVGNSVLDALDFDPTAVPLDSSTLPTANIAGVFQREVTAGSLTGNALVFARHAWTTKLTCTSGNTHVVDVYRFVGFYLTREAAGPEKGSPLGLNLSKFVSEPIVDAEQLDRVSDPTDLAEFALHLANGTPDDDGESHPAAVLVWARNTDLTVPDALREIQPGTGMLFSTPLVPRPTGAWRIQRDPGRSARGLLYYRHFSVATNFAHARFGVARFGQRSGTGDGFPHGFEIQVIGPSAGRQVLVHLSIATTNSNGTKAHCDLRTTAFVQDI